MSSGRTVDEQVSKEALAASFVDGVRRFHEASVSRYTAVSRSKEGHGGMVVLVEECQDYLREVF